MEANVERYYRWLMRFKVKRPKGIIVKIEYESKEFEFPVKRGNRFYKTDLIIYYDSGEYEYVEVKGFMDNDSRVKLKRFKQYYPQEFAKLILVDAETYKGIKKDAKNLVPHWE